MATTWPPVLRLCLLAHLLLLTAAAAADGNGAAQQQQQQPTKLTPREIERTMTSITVTWSDNTTAASGPLYHIEAQSLDTQWTLVSPKFNRTECMLPDLAVDAKYNICVFRSDGLADTGCEVIATIPAVRDDSLIALLIALAVLGAIILIALILWRCAIRRAAGEEDAGDTPSEEKPDAEDDEKHGGVNEKSPLLVPTTAETDQASPAPSDPANTQPDAGNQDQPQSLYLFLAGHAFK